MISQPGEEFYINIIDRHSGASMFSQNFGDGGCSEELCHLESAMIFTLSDFMNEIGRQRGGNGRLELIRRKKGLEDGREVYVDARLSYSENCILVSHISSGEHPTDRGAGGVASPAEAMLGEVDSSPEADPFGLASFEALKESLRGWRVREHGIDVIDEAGSEAVHSWNSRSETRYADYLESGLILTLLTYSDTLAEKEGGTLYDQPFLLQRSFDGDGSVFIDSRIFRGERYVLVTHQGMERRGYHAADELLGSVNEEVLGRFEKEKGGSFEGWRGDIDIFEEFANTVENVLDEKRSEFFSRYRKTILWEMESREFPAGVVRKLRRDFVGDSVDRDEFYQGLDALLDQPRLGEKFKGMMGEINRNYGPLAFVFSFELYRPG